jgi:hypothetical protein
MENNISDLFNRIIILIIFFISFFIAFAMQDYIFKYKVNQIIKENPSITLKEFMNC